ncbi:uncharacterized protein LOC142639464 [Castanea sativa]|uniref:uncharacterized protein LOC142639464 n=1 Tax=Castanea sativa TaxID=21020 RepID=UPI003F64D8F1
MARLLGIQNALSICPVINLQNKLNDEYNLILQLEEEIWAMKARTEWIIHGEQKTTYFHMSTLTMKPFKAPRTDGLHAGFFQRFWSLVGESVKREVKKIFTCQQVPEYLNQTLIALIPEQDGPKIINSMCENKRWDKIKASKNGPSFSHVFFADDLMVFAKANAKNCEAIIEVLDTFCKLVGQKVNLAKSRVLFSSNVNRRCKRSICRKLGINATQNLGQYLGFPLIYKGRNGDAFNFVIGRVQRKLSGWKTKFLSKAGKMNSSFVLPDRIPESIKATPFSCDTNAEDSLTWAYSKNGSFSLSPAYLLARGLNPLNLNTVSMSWVWKTTAPPRIQFFLWLCMHNSLPIREVLGSRGLNLNPTCPLCLKETESLGHLLRTCEFAQDFWQKLNYPRMLRESFNKPIKEWLEVNCNTNSGPFYWGIPWSIVFPTEIWHLWLQHNACVFRIGIPDTKINEKCKLSATEFFAIGMRTKLSISKSLVPVAWRKPPVGWAKLNTDGLALGCPRKARGGLIRDHNGEWVAGFSRSLGCTNSFPVELWALRDGLILARTLILIALLLNWMLRVLSNL